MSEDLRVVVTTYHDRTKHHYHRYAPSLGYLDWASQPDPYRRYAGAELIRLPLPPTGNALPYAAIYRPLPAQPLTIESLSLFFRYALSLTAQKSYGGSVWSLRANPSSGNLHPTEGYALLPALAGLGDAPALYHYAPKEHGLERRADFAAADFEAFASALPSPGFLVALSSIHWREAWKYGERAFRYCQHDAGHALATLRIAAAALGWRLSLLHADALHLSRLLSVNESSPAEPEEAELVALVSTSGEPIAAGGLLPDTAALVEGARFHGRPNVLSAEHVSWPVIDAVARATRCDGRVIAESLEGMPRERDLLAEAEPVGPTAETVILGRRSAVAMDGTTSMPAAAFFRLLARLLPSSDGLSMPWDALTWRPRIHLALFVHRVQGLPAGIYALVRDPQKLDALKSGLRAEFRWQTLPDCPSYLPLHLLADGDCRAMATSLSCGQEIAGDGVFSLAMIAQYASSLQTHGAAFYRNLFWEAGIVGQVLYLEAEAAGIRATGIGCYFDDPVHERLGIDTHEWQSLYHFTVGGPVEDRRLVTLPPYANPTSAAPDAAYRETPECVARSSRADLGDGPGGTRTGRPRAAPKSGFPRGRETRDT